MSGICGVVHFDGKPVDRETMAKMARADAIRGPDGVDYWVEANAGFAHLALHTLPEAGGIQRPFVDSLKGMVLTADARIDNRDELARTLAKRGYLPEPQACDDALILAAYECWGEDCPRYLIGDFAFVIWNFHQRKLFCARDAVGLRMLHYCQAGPTWVIATSIRAILAAIPAVPPMNEPLIRDFLAGNFSRWVDETAYRTIFRVPPAHTLTVQDGVPDQRRYWLLGGERPVRYQQDIDYIEHFRDLFQQVVLAQTRSEGPLAIIASGGLDSPSIACTVNHLIEQQGMDLQANLYSGVFESTPAADEREYIQAVAEQCRRLKSTLIPGDDCWGLKEFGADHGYPLDEPDISADRALSLRWLGTARKDGCRVALLGMGADEVLSAGVYCEISAFMDVDWQRVFVELPYFRRRSERPAWKILGYKGLSLLPFALRNLIQRWRAGWPAGSASFPQKKMYWPAHLRKRVHQLGYYYAASGITSARLVSYNTLAAYTGVEFRLPFFDRRLVDYILGLPPDLYFRDGFNKYILREAMKGILPERVRQQTHATHFSELTVRGVTDKEFKRVQELSTDARIVETRLASQDALSLEVEKACRERETYALRPFIRMLCVEAWLRNQ